MLLSEIPIQMNAELNMYLKVIIWPCLLCSKICLLAIFLTLLTFIPIAIMLEIL